MNRCKQLMLLLPFFVALLSTLSCRSTTIDAQQKVTQADSSISTNSNSVPSPYKEGKVEGIIPSLTIKDTLNAHALRALVLSQPPPEMWLIFPSSNAYNLPQQIELITPTIKVELPPEAKSVLKKHWVVSLSAQYDWEMKYKTDVGKRTELSIAIVNSSQKAAQELTKITIDAPDGRRSISQAEANDLVRFIGVAVVNVIEKIKSLGSSPLSECWFDFSQPVELIAVMGSNSFGHKRCLV